MANIIATWRTPGIFKADPQKVCDELKTLGDEFTPDEIVEKSWGQAVVRQEIDKYSTKFDSAVNIISNGGLIPVRFTEWRLDERLMTPKRGAPITTRLNHFIGWSADIDIEYTTNVYSISEIATIINFAGFSLGIGSGRTSGYGRYTIENIK